MKTRLSQILSGALLLTSALVHAEDFNGQLAQSMPPPLILPSFTVTDAKVVDVFRMLGEVGEVNIVVSSAAGERRVTLGLRKVTADQIIDAACAATGLVTRAEDGIIQVLTLEEYLARIGSASSRGFETRVFSVLFPNAELVGEQIEALYQDRVTLTVSTDFGDIEKASSSSSNSDSNSNANNNSNSSNNENTSGNQSSSVTVARLATQDEVRSGERTGVVSTIRGDSQPASTGTLVDLPILVSVNAPNNLIVVRSADRDALDDIARLIIEVDRPTPQVLLEMKVLQVSLTNGERTAFEFGMAQGSPQTAIPDGQPANPLVPSAPTAPTNVGALLAQPFQGGSVVYQYMNDTVRLRLEALATEGRLVSVGSPMLLCANNRMAELFIGEERQLVTGFSGGQSSQNSNTTLVSGVVPIVEEREIGQLLRIMPRINEDRTVSLLIDSESSQVVVGGALIPIQIGNQLVEQPVDTVNTSRIKATVIAKDQLAVALGGLIREEQSTNQTKVPWLGDIPILGWLFQDNSSSTRRTELIVIITPRILMTPGEGEAVTRERLRALSLHPWTIHGDRAVRAYTRDSVPGQPAAEDREWLDSHLVPTPSASGAAP